MTQEEGSPSRGLRDLDAIDTVFEALGHASRRHILQVLAARNGEMTAGELAARFTHSWPTTTRHLRVLLRAGLVSVSSVGRERHYRLELRRMGETLALWLPSVGFELRGPGAGDTNTKGVTDEEHGQAGASCGDAS
ncbi:MAG: ArsR/SmtB family transcription factor [Thermocrispum sp.]